MTSDVPILQAAFMEEAAERGLSLQDTKAAVLTEWCDDQGIEGPDLETRLMNAADERDILMSTMLMEITRAWAARRKNN